MRTLPNMMLFIFILLGYFLISASGADISGQDSLEASMQSLSMFTRVTEGPHVNDLGLSMGVSWQDYDNDNNPDLFVSYHDRLNKLYKNNGDGSFSEVPGSILITDGYSNGSCWADYDNDGNLDAYVVNGLHEKLVNYYYLNNGDGSFTKITTGSLVTDLAASMTAVSADYDNDRALDIFTPSWMFSGLSDDQLYQGVGDGMFTKITSGPVVTDVEPSGNSLWFDFDDDNDQDLIVSKAAAGASAVLFTNDGGIFTPVTGLNFLTVERGQGFDFGDFDNDGDQDLFIPTWEGYNSALFENTGGGSFTRITDQPITSDGHWSTASCTGDFDNDGDLDIYLVNDNNYEDRPDYFYINDGHGVFTSFVDSTFIDNTGYYSCKVSFADFDRDGDLDLYVVNWYTEEPNLLFRNNGNSNHWLEIKPIGTFSNISGIGTKVRVLAGIGGSPVWQTRELRSHVSSRAQSPLEFHFGLGNAAVIDTILAEWPSGIVDTLSGVTVNQFLTRREGDYNDLDGDGVPDIDDNCPDVYNPGQEDSNSDGVGNDCCCIDIAGNVDCSENEEPDISDITRLIDYLYLSHDVLCCPDEADANGSGDPEPDISDITKIIDYLYIGHSPLSPCPVSMLEIPHGSTVSIDGTVGAEEWNDAAVVTLSVGGEVEVTIRVKHDGVSLLAAYTYVFPGEENLCFPELILDTENDKSESWLSDDWWFHVSGTDCEGHGTYDVWNDCSVTQPDWEGVPNFALVQDPPPLDTFEIRIPFSKVGLATGDIIGLAFRIENVPYMYGYWPAGAVVESPSSWVTAVLKP